MVYGSLRMPRSPFTSRGDRQLSKDRAPAPRRAHSRSSRVVIINPRVRLPQSGEPHPRMDLGPLPANSCHTV